MSLQYTVAGVLQLNKELSDERDYYQQQCRQQYDILAYLEKENEALVEEKVQLDEERARVNEMKKELHSLREAKLNSKGKDIKINELSASLRTIENKCKTEFEATFEKMKKGEANRFFKCSVHFLVSESVFFFVVLRSSGDEKNA